MGVSGTFEIIVIGTLGAMVTLFALWTFTYRNLWKLEQRWNAEMRNMYDKEIAYYQQHALRRSCGEQQSRG